MLTAERLREVLSYDPETGVFRRRFTRAANAPAGELVRGSKQRGYLRTSVDGVEYKMHRLAWLYLYGEWPSGIVDHVDGNKTNNRAANLREATLSQNKGNSRIHANNTSGAKGVNRSHGKWRARIQVNGKWHALGVYNTVEAASNAYQAAAAKHFGEFARTA